MQPIDNVRLLLPGTYVLHSALFSIIIPGGSNVFIPPSFRTRLLNESLTIGLLRPRITKMRMSSSNDGTAALLVSQPPPTPASSEPEEGTTTTTAQQKHIVFPLSAFFQIRDSLEEWHNFPAISVPARNVSHLRNRLSHVLLHHPKYKTIFSDPTDDSRRILLLRSNRGSSSSSSSSRQTTTTLQQPLLRETPAAPAVADEPDSVLFRDEPLASVLRADDDCRRLTHHHCTTYADMTVDEVFRTILPVKEVPTAFEMVGTKLVHLNLRPDVVPYKLWVGQVLLDKIPSVRTVVNKVGAIDTEFRTFGMEVIAGEQGEGWSRVTVKEEGCVFELDFREVYWNSRLSGEHSRLVKLIAKDTCNDNNNNNDINNKKRAEGRHTTVVADLMSGVGPFAVPLTATATRNKIHKGRIHVHANDLNPSSYKYLKLNAARNKCEHLSCYNMDARLFVGLLQTRKPDGDTTTSIDHVIMNLPASAPEFLDAFRGWSLSKLPRIHVHCFCSKTCEATGYLDAIRRCATALGCPLDMDRDAIHIHVVRDVSPRKNMLCVSFDLPEAVRQVLPISTTTNMTTPPATTATRPLLSTKEGPETKRTRTD
jgi:tRNA (guanine37-N1)-methyltransferase